MAKVEFISTMSKIVQEVYTQYGTVLPSVCIAQAALESGWRTNVKSLFGIKSKSGNTMNTQEFINGKYVTVSATFKSYSNLSEAVVQYYELMNTTRYKDVKNLQSAEEQIKFIKTRGYATDPDYVEKILKIIKQNNLTQYDVMKSTSTRKSNEEVAKDVVAGKYGNGAMRRAKLQQEGYDYRVIQQIVNNMLK